MSERPDKPVEAVCREVAAEILGVAPESMRLDSGAENLAGWDSLNVVRIILATEARLNTRLSRNEIERLSVFGDIV
ncbi:MAG TPA: acyl carrier protein, partial [Rhizomicrobium sp.]|nr:acyl carrier protein [Rhizomicrobium sp.]